MVIQKQQNLTLKVILQNNFGNDSAFVDKLDYNVITAKQLSASTGKYISIIYKAMNTGRLNTIRPFPTSNKDSGPRFICVDSRLVAFLSEK